MNRTRPVRFRQASAALLAAAAILSAGCASTPEPRATDPSQAAALAGEWGIQIHLMEHTVDGVLRFTREGPAIIGSFIDDEGNQSELERLRVGEGKISWQMDRKDGTLAAKGTIEGSLMSGKMKLKRRAEEDSGFGVSGGGGRRMGGRRVGEPDSFSWTAVKRAETAPAPPPRPTQR